MSGLLKDACSRQERAEKQETCPPPAGKLLPPLRDQNDSVKLGLVYGDALQVAIAVCQRMDIVVSWNMKHLVNVRKVAAMNRVNLEYGLPPIRIHTPEEVMPL